jgi:hypothetical protein
LAPGHTEEDTRTQLKKREKNSEETGVAQNFATGFFRVVWLAPVGPAESARLRRRP